MILNEPMSEERKMFCEYWLCFWTNLAKNLTHPRFNEFNLRYLIIYEANTRRRKRVIKLLMGRYSKLRKKREIRTIEKYMGGIHGSQRANYRAVSSFRSSKEGWKSNQANLLKS